MINITSPERGQTSYAGALLRKRCTNGFIWDRAVEAMGYFNQ